MAAFLMENVNMFLPFSQSIENCWSRRQRRCTVAWKHHKVITMLTSNTLTAWLLVNFEWLLLKLRPERKLRAWYLINKRLGHSVKIWWKWWLDYSSMDQLLCHISKGDIWLIPANPALSRNSFPNKAIYLALRPRLHYTGTTLDFQWNRNRSTSRLPLLINFLLAQCNHSRTVTILKQINTVAVHWKRGLSYSG